MQKEEVMMKNGHTIYDYIVKFADYGFNKNHAVAYSMISYQMAYEPITFTIHGLTFRSSTRSHHTISLIINEARKANIEVVNPSINISGLRFKTVGNKIYYSLLGIMHWFSNCKFNY